MTRQSRNVAHGGLRLWVVRVLFLSCTFPAWPACSGAAAGAQSLQVGRLLTSATASLLNSTRRILATGDTGEQPRMQEPDDYWSLLVGTPSRLGGKTKKQGVLPWEKYDLEKFSIAPFQVGLGCIGWACVHGVDDAWESDVRDRVLHPVYLPARCMHASTVLPCRRAARA